MRKNHNFIFIAFSDNVIKSSSELNNNLITATMEDVENHKDDEANWIHDFADVVDFRGEFTFL